MEKKTKYLYGAAVQGIQGFIFQTNKLREIVGASELVEEICTDMFVDLFPKVGVKYEDENCILHAAGNIKYIFDNEDECNKIVRVFPKMVAEFAPGITASQAVVKMEREFSEFKDAVGELEKRLRVQRNKLMRSATLGLMGIQRSRQTGLPVVLKPNDKGKNDLIDASTWAKLYEIDKKNNQVRKKTNLSLCKKAFCKTDEEKELLKHEQVAYDIEKITKNNDWIAIIHADGNGLGQIVQAIETDTQKFKKFSESLDKATQAAAVKAYDSVKGRFDKSKFIPIRPIVLGGDDFTVICRADLALDYATEFIKQFEEKTKFVVEYKDKLGFNHLTACAGIAYIKSSFPFYYGYALAEALCSKAKEDAKKDLEDGELVLCYLLIDGYSLFSLILASLFVNCQLMVEFLLFRCSCQSATSFFISSMVEICLFKHCLFKTCNSISAILSQLPCFGVNTKSNLSHILLASSGSNASYSAPGVCVLKLSITNVILSACGNISSDIFLIK